MTQALYPCQDIAIHEPRPLFSAPHLPLIHHHPPGRASGGIYAMEQASLQQQQRKPRVAAQTRLWPTDNLPQDPNMDPSTTAATGYSSGTSTSGAMSRFWASAANARAFHRNHGLPMAPPMVAPAVDYQGSSSHHFDYAGTLKGRSIGVKNEGDYTDGSLWPLPMRQPTLLQPINTVDSSDVETGTVSLSPRSAYFSEPSEQGTAYSPIPGREEASSSGAWAEQSSVSPIQIKQSPSHSSVASWHGQLKHATGEGMGSALPATRLATVDVVPSMAQHFDVPFGSQVDQYGLTWPTMATQTNDMGALAWQPPIYPQMQANTQSPYYSTGFVDPFKQDTHGSGSNTRGAVVQSCAPSREVHRNAPRQEIHGLPHTPHTTDEQAQRDVENRILVEGKAAGLTYKEIRTKIMRRFGGEVAESTLRGRHRAMTKQKKDRVRKPTWMPKDLRLLREVVEQQLDSIDDGHRSVDVTARLNKVSWKKVGEYISERGGSYHFGNSTCKKKWLEINQHD